MKYYKILSILALSLFVMFGVSHSAFAQTSAVSGSGYSSSSSSSAITGPTCFPFPVDIRYGSYDSSTQNGVTSLQNFLAQQGYFNSAYIGSGHYGPLTLQAVMKFQAANALPSTGFVGPLTRAEIISHCGNPNPISGVTMNSLSPSQAPVGATVTIYGANFTNDNTIIMDGSIAVRDVAATYPPLFNCPPGAMCATPVPTPITNCPVGAMCATPATNTSNPTSGMMFPNYQTITFTIPSSLSPNCPTGSMCPTNQPISITGLDAPASLHVGQTGTWTVHAVTTTTSGQLHYSVNWGDTYSASPTGIMAPQNASVTTSSSFTHAYQQAGTYTASFTVTDDYGHSASATNTITVSSIYY